MHKLKTIKVWFHLHDLAVQMLHSPEFNCPEYDRAMEEHEAIYADFFRQLMEKEIDCFSLFTSGDRVNGNEVIYHRSTKKPGVQASYIWWHNGELIPSMDEQYSSPKEMSKPDNVVITVYKN